LLTIIGEGGSFPRAYQLAAYFSGQVNCRLINAYKAIKTALESIDKPRMCGQVCNKLAKTFHKKSCCIRQVILGHVQRDGSRLSQDRLLVTKFGAYAVEMALAGKPCDGRRAE